MKKVTIILVLLGIVAIIISLSFPVHAAGDASVVKDGDDVLQTIDGKIYIGQGVSFNGSWITLFNIRFPVDADGEPVGAVTVPSERVTILYHKGPINIPVTQPAPKEEDFGSW